MKRIEKVAAAGFDCIVLREKGMCEDEYREYAIAVKSICDRYGTPLKLHKFRVTARDMDLPIHLPMEFLKKLNENDANLRFGASCHSVIEAAIAESYGCEYIFAGHIYNTECKKGTPGRGLDFLREVVKAVSIPVYAIGGINEDNIKQTIETGVKGVCVMSGAMTAPDVKEYLHNLKKQIKL